ncbi:MAG: M1 family metallopeptidase [Candidatus Micrarchaeia archaeon]
MEKNLHIDRDITPMQYSLRIEPDMKKFVYDGFEQVDVEIQNYTDTIAMNAKELEIDRAEITCNGAKYLAKVSEDKKNEKITLRISKRIKGKATIEISFKGFNNDKMYGFYRSRYKNEKNGKDEYLLTTQFEAADARSAFPCFDEPALKASFSIELVVDKGLDAISNMPISKISSKGNKNAYVFEKTPPMPTYLVYMGVGKFEYLKGKLGKLPIRIVTVPGKKKYASLALELTKKFVAFYEKYFGIKYPLPKLDMIAIPDFAAGAMENWGAITFREIDLLGDRKSIATASLQSIAETVAHELAHQWFGDLVTMKWWDDLWLNESFATFMSFKAMDHVFPKWDIGTQSFIEINSVAMAADQLRSTHPISVEVKTPAEIDEIFDEISYEKGGSILKMLEDYIGYETFRKGLHRYLKKHSYGNATKYDLWGALDEEAKNEGKRLKVSETASSWIDLQGYPVVELTGKKLTQRRFALLGIASKCVWPIPMHYLDAKGEHFSMMNSKAMDLAYDGFAKLNYGQKGFYRTKYSQENLEELGKLIERKKLPRIDAWGIENDLYALLRARMVKLGDYLDFVSRHCVDPEYPLNASIARHLLGLYVTFYFEKGIAERIREIGTNYYNALMEKIGLEKKPGEPMTTTLLRSDAVAGLAIMGGSERVENKLKNIFNDKLSGRAVDQNLSNAAYIYAAWNGSSDVFGKLTALFKKEKMPDEQRRLLGSLGYFRDGELIEKALEFSISNSVRMQDSFVINSRAAANPFATELLWRWTKAKWSLLKKRYGSGTHMLGRYVSALSSIKSIETKKEIERFFASKENWRDDIKLALKQALEQIEINYRLIEFNKETAHGKN